MNVCCEREQWTYQRHACLLVPAALLQAVHADGWVGAEVHNEVDVRAAVLHEPVEPPLVHLVLHLVDDRGIPFHWRVSDCERECECECECEIRWDCTPSATYDLRRFSMKQNLAEYTDRSRTRRGFVWHIGHKVSEKCGRCKGDLLSFPLSLSPVGCRAPRAL